MQPRTAMLTQTNICTEGVSNTDVRKRTKVVHLTSVHPASDVRIFHKECVTLAQAGYEVVIVAPNAADGIESGVRKRGVPHPSNRLQRMVCTAFQVFSAGLAEKAEIYHFHDPELIPAGVLLKLLGKRVVYDAHENLPLQILKKDWLPRSMRSVIGRIVDSLERWSALKLDGIVAATPGIAKRFPSHKTITVHNFPILKEFQRSIRMSTERQWFAYVGGLESIRGVREMVRAMELLPPKSGARLMLAGNFDPPSLLDEVRSLPGWQHVTYLGWQSREGIADLLGSARAGLVVLHRNPHFLESYPIKLFEYMAVGIPVIASDFPLWRSIVEKEGCGILVDPKDPAAIAKALDWVLQNPDEAKAMGRRGLNAVHDRYNWKQEESKLTAFYARLFKK